MNPYIHATDLIHLQNCPRLAWMLHEHQMPAIPYANNTQGFSSLYQSCLQLTDAPSGAVGDSPADSLAILRKEKKGLHLRFESQGVRTQIPVLIQISNLFAMPAVFNTFQKARAPMSGYATLDVVLPYEKVTAQARHAASFLQEPSRHGYVAIYPHLSKAPGQHEADTMALNQRIAADNGIHIVHHQVAYVDGDYVRHGDLEADKLIQLSAHFFKKAGCPYTKTIDMQVAKVAKSMDLTQLAAWAKDVFSHDLPEPKKCRLCVAPRKCSQYELCFSEADHPDTDISFLFSSHHKNQLIQKGITNMADVPARWTDGFGLQYAQIQAARSLQKEQLDQPGQKQPLQQEQQDQTQQKHTEQADPSFCSKKEGVSKHILFETPEICAPKMQKRIQSANLEDKAASEIPKSASAETSAMDPMSRRDELTASSAACDAPAAVPGHNASSSPSAVSGSSALVPAGMYVDTYAIRQWISQLVYPLIYLDFEWDTFALPPYDGMKPFDVLCFQYSMHIEDEQGNLSHENFFAGGDCRERFIQDLLLRIPKTGSILVYNMEGAEKLRLLQLAEQFPKYEAELRKVCDRMVDLSMLFESGACYDLRQRGKFSLKSVLPIFDAGAGYSTLDVKDGLEAIAAYRRHEAAQSEEERLRIAQSISDYCAMDTMAEVEILHGLQRFVTKEN